jgi:integrase
MQQDHLEPAGNRAGIPVLSWHSFRHTYGTIPAELDEAIEVQQKVMRHTDTRGRWGYDNPKFEKQRRQTNNKVFEMMRTP